MKKIMIVIAALSFAAFMAAPVTVFAEDPLPACATDGDMDGDGVLDADDSDEQDSCSATSTGLEDCETGQGDGLLDCTVE